MPSDESQPPAAQDASKRGPAVSLATSVQMAVRDRIRHDILNGRLMAGTRLQQAELAKTYGVSITPVREALRDLAAVGLVNISPFLGAVVHTPTLRELEDIYQVRVELIPLTVQLGVHNITPEELAQAEELIQLMDVHTNPDPWVSHNARFHHILEGACRNDQLAGTMRRLADLSQVYVAMCERITPRPGRANHVHRQILDAYRRCDVDEAISCTLRHITDTQEDARDEFKQMRDAAKLTALSGAHHPASQRKPRPEPTEALRHGRLTAPHINE